MAEIILENVCKSFKDTKVIENLNLTIQDGKFTVLVGPSGCGKTTLLRMIAGIGRETSGRILMDGQDISELAPGKRGVAMVFQNYAIYPTMSVRGNIEFGLKNNKIPKEDRDALIKEVSEIVGLTPYLDRKPNALSGGQRQRVALARAMVKKPKVFLMDEPLSNLDAKLRATMRSELIELHKRLEATFIYVTHDQVEAMSMADTIVLMDKGKIMQQAAPEEIYKNPENIFTAQFIGTPPMNIIKMPNPARGEWGDTLHVGFRPEQLRLSDGEPGEVCKEAAFSRRGEILTREMLGSETIYRIKTGKDILVAKSTDSSFARDQKVYLTVKNEALYFFDKEGVRILRQKEEPDYLKVLEAIRGQDYEA